MCLYYIDSRFIFYNIYIILKYKHIILFKFEIVYNYIINSNNSIINVMSSKYIKICKNCKNILHREITNYKIVFKCQSCLSVFSSTEEDSMIMEVHKGTLRMTQKKGENIYYNVANPKEKRDCINSKCDAKIVRYEREEDGRKKYGCKCGNVWVINQSY